jgi:hypothetical protein
MAGVAPFFDTCSIVDTKGAELVAEVGVSIWPEDQLSTSTGLASDYGGIIEQAAAEHLIDAPQRRLVIGGKTYNVVEALPQTEIGTIDLRLKSQTT